MLSRVDIAPSATAATALPVSIVKVREVSNGVSVSRLHSGGFALSVHDGDRHAVVDVTGDELRDFARRLLQLVG